MSLEPPRPPYKPFRAFPPEESESPASAVFRGSAYYLPPFNIAIVFAAFLLAGTLSRGWCEDKKQESNADKVKEATSKDDWRARPIYLLKVGPGVATKEKMTDGKLVPKRFYARSEPRIFGIDEKTGEKIYTGGWGVDFTNDANEFLDEPRRLLRVGSVVPGSMLGDNDDRNYQFTSNEGTFASRFRQTQLPVSFVVINFYKDGMVTEAMFGPHLKIVR